MKRVSLNSQTWFETGLMNHDITAWSGADWIGGSDEDEVLYALYLSVFRLEYTMQVDAASQSTKGSLILGANDPRLMDKIRN